MLSLTINNKEEKLNIGCLTFINLYELLHLLEVPSGTPLNVHVNAQQIEPREFMMHKISSGDSLTIK